MSVLSFVPVCVSECVWSLMVYVLPLIFPLVLFCSDERQYSRECIADCLNKQYEYDYEV